MRRLAAALVVAAAVLIQLSLLPALRPFGVVPNLLLVVIVLVCLSLPTSEVLVAAAAGGLVLDLGSGANFGLWTGVLMLVALVGGVLHRAGIELDRAPVAPALVAVGTILIAVGVWIGLLKSGGPWPGLSPGGRLLVELVINLSLTMLLRGPLGWLMGMGRQASAGG